MSTHPFYRDLEDVMSKVSAVAWDLNDVASRADGAGPWRSRVRTLVEDQFDILRKLDELEDEFTKSTNKE